MSRPGNPETDGAVPVSAESQRILPAGRGRQVGLAAGGTLALLVAVGALLDRTPQPNPADQASQQAAGKEVDPTKTPIVLFNPPTLTPLRFAAAEKRTSTPSATPRVLVDTRVYDSQSLRAAGYNPANPENFANHVIEECLPERLADAGLWDKVAVAVEEFLAVPVAEAADLEAPLEAATPAQKEKFVKCVQAVEKERPVLTAKGRNVQAWTVDNVVDKVSIKEARTRVAAEAKSRGINLSQAQIDQMLGSKVRSVFLKPDGTLSEFDAIIEDLTPAELEKKYGKNHPGIHSSGEEVWIVVDGQVFEIVFGDCTNVVIAQQVPPAETPEAPATPTKTPTTAAPTAVPPTAVPPTAVPPTAVPPTAVPPTAVPPTAVPPTAVPPTAVPPTAVPPTAVPPTRTPVPPTATPRRPEQPTPAPTQATREPVLTAGPTASVAPTRVPNGVMTPSPAPTQATREPQLTAGPTRPVEPTRTAAPNAPTATPLGPRRPDPTPAFVAPANTPTPIRAGR